jgi:exosortase A
MTSPIPPVTMPFPSKTWALPTAIWVGLLALAIAAQWGAASSMAAIWWRSETFAHCLLVLPISLWLVWRERLCLAVVQPRTCWLALLPLLLAGALALVGDLASVNAARHFALVFSVQALVWLVFGTAVVRQLWFPLVFLWFAPPFGEFLMPQMMDWTADFTIAALQLTGVPVYREGLQFVIPSGNWSVVEACSGVRYLMASLMVGSLFAYLNFAGWRRRLAFVVFSAAVPILANWLRAYLIVMLGHLSGNQLATGADHLIYGWVFFGIIMLAMFWVGMRFADAPLGLPSADPTRVRPAAPVGARAAPLLLALLSAAVLLVPAWWAQHVRAGLASEAPPLAGALEARWQPLAPAGWQAAAPGALADARWRPVYTQPDLHTQTHWQQGGQAAVTLDTIVYLRQRADGKLVSSVNTLVPSKRSDWVRLSSQAALVDGLPMEETLWRHRDGQGPAQEWRVRRVMLVDGRYTAKNWQAKLYGVWQLLKGGGDSGLALVMVTPEDGAAAERLAAFWRDIRTPANERLKAVAAAGPADNAPLPAVAN